MIERNNPISRSRGRQPVYIPPSTGVHGHRPGVHVPAVRPCDIGQSVHRQTDQPVKVLRLRLLRQRRVGAGRDTGDERLPNRYKETQSSIETLQGAVETVLEYSRTCS